MATIEYWIQLENHAWDLSPRGRDRMSGEHAPSTKFPRVTKTITSPETGVSHNRVMNKPTSKDALIFRRYTANWAVPDDRKINPWDINEPNPTDNGTMGTIPGPTIECSMGDTVVVHFRNKDFRAGKHAKERCHSMHPHGFVFHPAHDGAYPLSPPDPAQPVGPESGLWSSVGVTGLKKGDRVPPGGTFDYTWSTRGWPTTAGVWLYHDHAICDMDNVGMGAIGTIVIHNPADPDDVAIEDKDLPGGSWIGSPIVSPLIRFEDISILPHDLEQFTSIDPEILGQDVAVNALENVEEERRAPMPGMETPSVAEAQPRAGRPESAQPSELKVLRGNLQFEIDDQLQTIKGLRLGRYRTPPAQAQYLVLIHEMDGQMCLNGRVYLGNTPTVLGGPDTVMRFGVVGMGSQAHTFHLHGHRWVLTGPDGTDTGTIQNSPQIRAVSQFEDTRILGPANSFGFTIREGTSFMGAFPGEAKGEWHMHCHVLAHMMGGMMGSLLIVDGGELATPLPEGEPCPGDTGGGNGGGTGSMTATVRSTNSCAWRDDASGTPETTIMAGGTVTFIDGGCSPHTLGSNNVPPFDSLSPALTQDVTAAGPAGVSRVFPTPGNYGYHCAIHGGDPVARTGMWGIIHVV